MGYPEFASYAIGSTSNINSSKEVVSTKEDPDEEMTPTEQLEKAYHSIVDDLAADLLQKTLEQSPYFFEHLVVDLLVKMGYGGSFANSAQVTQYVHDDGIDGIIYEDKLGLDKIYIQAKRYKLDNTVGKPQIQQFSGALDEQKATKGVFITTSSYSKEAKQYVQNLNKKIVLIDGQELARYMIEYNVGVSTKQVYEVKRIDSDYFEE
jgi:restriction system protein